MAGSFTDERTRIALTELAAKLQSEAAGIEAESAVAPEDRADFQSLD